MDYKVKDNSRYAFSFQGSKIYLIFVAFCAINLALLLATNSAALAYCVGLTDDGGGWRLPTVDEFINACSRDEACRNEGSNGVLYRTATPVIPSTAHPYATPPWPDWVVANYWKLDAYTGVFEEPAAYVRCVK